MRLHCGSNLQACLNAPLPDSASCLSFSLAAASLARWHGCCATHFLRHIGPPTAPLQPASILQCSCHLCISACHTRMYSREWVCTWQDVAFWTSSMYTENNLCEIVRSVAGDLVEETKLIDDFTHPKTVRPRPVCLKNCHQSCFVPGYGHSPAG